MRLQRISLLLLPLFAVGVSIPVPVYLPALLATQKAIAQTPNEQKLDQNPITTPTASGSFVDYFAQEAQLKGHEGSVNSASFSPDGKLIVTAGTDGTARVWDTSGKQVVELRGHSASVRSASFSPDGQRIVTGSFDGTARVWDLSGKQLVELTGHQGNVFSASFSPDGGRIVTAGADKTVRVWDASGKQLVEIKGHEGSVYSASFSPDGKRIVTASADKTARVWDLSGKQLAELTGHTDTVWSASFSPDGQRIVTASDDKTARLWDSSGKQLAELNGHTDSVYSASFSPDGQRIITASMDFIGLVWESSGKLVGKLQGHEGGVNSVSWSRDSQWIVTASNGGIVRVWDTSIKLFTELQDPISTAFPSSEARFSPDGKLIVTVSLRDSNPRIWDTSNHFLVELRHPDSVNSVNFSPDSKLIVTASTDETARVWDVSGKLLAELKGHEGWVNSASFSPDGKLIVTASTDKTARVWDISGKLLAELKGHQDSVNSASFSPDGKLIITASADKTARVWDISGKLLAELKGHQGSVKSASFSPDGKLIVTESEGSTDGKLIVTASEGNTARVWDTSGNLLVELPHSNSFDSSPSFSPDGKRILTVVEGGLRVWDTSGNLLAESKENQCPVSSASFSPDGKLIVAASGDKRTNEPIACVLDTSGKLLAQLKGHKNSLSVNFSPDGKRIVTASEGDNLRVWYLSDKLLAQFRVPETPAANQTELFPPNQESLNQRVVNVNVNIANFSPDGKLIVTVGGIARLWDISGKLLVELKGHQGGINSASFSPDGKLIVTASWDGTARVWDISGKFLVELKHKDGIYNASFSPNGKLIVTRSRDGIVRVWDTSGTLQAELKGHKYLVSVNFSPDSKLIVTASWDGTARVWDISGKLLAELKGHTQKLNNASFSPDSKLIVTASQDGTARVWDISGKLLAELKEPLFKVNSGSSTRANVSSASFSPDGQRIITTNISFGTTEDNTEYFNCTAYVWDISGKLVAELRREYGCEDDANFSPDGQLIVTASSDNTARVWDISGRLLAELKGHTQKVNSASFSPDGKLIVTASQDRTARVWDISGKTIAELKWHRGVIRATFSPDAQKIVTVSDNWIAHVWDISGKLLAELRGHTNRITSASFSPDEKLIVTTSWDNTARVWDISGKLVAELRHEREVNDADFSPDGKLIVTASGDKTARVWDINGKQVMILQGHPEEVKNASFSPDGKQILTVSSAARVWNTNGELISETVETAKMWAMVEEIKQIVERFKQIAFQSNGGGSDDSNIFISPDGQIVFTFTFSVSSSSGTLVFFWDSSSEQPVQVKLPLSYVHSASFSSDRKRIVTISYDGTAHVWDISGKQLATLELPAPPSSAKVEADRLSNLEFDAPNCAAAFEPWQKALKIYQEIADYENESLMLHKLGYAYHCLSDYTNAINFYSQALSLAQKHNYLERQAGIYLSLGSIYYALADYDKAIKYYDNALKIVQEQDSPLKAIVLHARGDIYYYQKKYDEANQNYLQASAIYEKVRDASRFAKISINLASLYQSSGDYNKAIQYYKKAEEFSPIEALAGLGNTYLALGDTAKAIDLHNQSLAKARQQADKEGEANTLNNLANALRKAGKLPEAEQYLRDAIEIWENLRISLEDANKVSIFEKQSQTYRLLQEILIAQNKPEEALEIAERGRARAFVELLASRISPDPNEQPSITPPNVEQIKQIAKAQNATLVEYSIIYDTFNVQGKEQTKESELYIWVIKPTGEVTFRRSDLKPLWQKENTTLGELVTTSREAIGVRSMFDVTIVAKPEPDETQRLQQLHDLLIKPIADLLPTNPSDRIIFIPQTSLFLVPFPALQDESGKYLIEKHTLLTAPSIQVLQLTQQQRQRVATRSNNAVVVGNPTMPKVAPAIGQPPQQLPPLPGAEAEAKAIAPLLNTQALTGDRATKFAILPLLPSARIIHLATHGILDDIQGLKSALALAPSEGRFALAPSSSTPPPEAPPLTKGEIGGVEGSDGLLTAEEILDLQLNAELVVLSACDTGRGRITGDGVIGLSRSFISAGVPSVIVSLWSVPDAPTASLMTEFYNNLQLNPDKAQALRQAMLTTLKQHPNPKNWAAFTLIGESQ